MPGALLWGWDDTNKVWIKLQVDANGYVKVDMSNINLDDLADVSVATPADDDLFYYDDATGLWKSRKLVDADIPAAIARDAEVDAKIAASEFIDHPDTPASYSGQAGKVVRVDSGESALEFVSPPLFSTAIKTYYIDSVNGDDSNGGEASDDAFKTWVKAESMIPITVDHAYTIRIIGDLAEAILLSGRNCNAALLIRGDTTTPADHVVNSITITRCFGNWRVMYLNSSGQITVNASLGLTSIHGDIRHCEPRNSGGYGIYVFGSIIGIRDCDFGTDVVWDCIASANSRVFSRSNSGNGTRYGLNASYAGTIGKYFTQPTGSTANENAAAGGVIR